MNREASCLALLVLACSSSPPVQGAERPPNVVLVFADDLGYGDVGVYGATRIRTPHIDRLAREGVRFTDLYVAQAVCSASRAALLTGAYPNRVGILGALGPASRVGISDGETTLGELLKGRGYATAIYGKWHLGHLPPFLPMRHGFDDYLGLPYSNDMWPNHPEKMRFPPLPLYSRDGVLTINPDQSQLTGEYTRRAIAFMKANRERPFFVYLPHTMVHVPLFASGRFRGRSAQGLYGDVVEEVDDSVGQILAAIRELGLERETLVIFTSDNGPWLSYGDHAGSAGPLREGKGTAFEGGVRVPFVARWPGRIRAGAVVNEPAMTIDVLPTIARLVGASLPARPIDGLDITPLLLGEEGARAPHEALLFYYGSELRALRSGRHKLVLPHRSQTLHGRAGTGGIPAKYEQVDVPLALYDLVADVGETTDVSGAHPDVVARLQALAETAREDLGDSLTGRTGRGLREPGRAEAPAAAAASSGAGRLRPPDPAEARRCENAAMEWVREIEVCRDVARRAGELALRHAARGVLREDKADDSPVTVADRECEQLIVSELRAAFPGDGFVGEEGADHGGTTGRRWIVDPIDGTRDFLRGLPTWSNLIGLEVDGEVVLGTCNLAAQGELYWAVRGQGAFVNGRQVRVSTIDRRDRSIACLTAFDNIAASPFADRILEHLAGYWAVRSMGGCQDAMLVISGRAEAWFEISAEPWDLAPLKVLAAESGARFFNFDGGSSIEGGNAVICAPFLEAELRAFVGARPPA